MTTSLYRRSGCCRVSESPVFSNGVFGPLRLLIGQRLISRYPIPVRVLPTNWFDSFKNWAGSGSVFVSRQFSEAVTTPFACILSTTCVVRSEEHTSELQSLAYLVCRLLLEKKNN